jgi:hypothetical protein
MRRPWFKHGTKHLNENLAPLRRYLQANVGRPWDKVYSEVCEQINRDSAVQLHVWQHLMQDVCRDPHEVLGYVRRPSFPGLVCRFYVDPRNGLLRENTEHRHRRRTKLAVESDRITVDDTHEYRRIDGIWYELELSPIASVMSFYDMALRRSGPEVTVEELVRFYGRRVYAIHKRQLNKREIRRLTARK